MPKILLHFDGLCEPRNPGGIAVAAYLAFDVEKNPEVLDGDFLQVMTNPFVCGGRVVADGGPKATNNVAEWCALGCGLAGLLDCDEWVVQNSLLIRGDSQLVINQLNGKWRVKAEHLRPYRDRCLEILNELGCEWTAEWVRRDRNDVAYAHGRRIYNHYRKHGGSR